MKTRTENITCILLVILRVSDVERKTGETGETGKRDDENKAPSKQGAWL